MYAFGHRIGAPDAPPEELVKVVTVLCEVSVSVGNRLEFSSVSAVYAQKG